MSPRPPISTLFPYTTLFRSGAVNQKGPEAAFLAALHALRGAKRKLPVNLVLVAEGEEEIGSPHIGQIVQDRKSTRLNSSHRCISYAVFCLKKKLPAGTHAHG